MKPVLPVVAPLPLHVVASAAPVIPRDRILRLHDVEHLCGLSKSSIYSLAKEGKFPKQIHIHRRMTGWSEAAVLTWVQARLAQGGVQ